MDLPRRYRAGSVAGAEPAGPHAAHADANRTWFAFGAGYQQSERLSFDVGVVYLKIDSAHIHKTTADSENAVRGNLVGDYQNSAKILSAQVKWLF